MVKRNHIIKVVAAASIIVASSNLSAAEQNNKPSDIPQNTIKLGNVTSSFDISLYGYIKLNAIYDSQTTVNGDLGFYVLPKTNGKNDDEFNMTARESRLGLKIHGPEAYNGNLAAQLEVDFYGRNDAENSYHPRLRLAFIDWSFDSWSIRLGQDWETFITVAPKVVDFATMADKGALGLRRAQARITKNITINDTSEIFLKGALATTIGQDSDLDGQNDGKDSGIPTFQYNIGYTTQILTQQKTKFSISGHFGNETTDINDKNDSKDFETWSLIASLSLPFTEQLSLSGSIWTGENLDTYFGGIGQGINTDKNTGIAASGGWAQLMILPKEKTNINLFMGIDNPDTKDLSEGMRSKNTVIGANIYYSINKALIASIEYQNIETQYYLQDKAVDNRIEAAVAFCF